MSFCLRHHPDIIQIRHSIALYLFLCHTFQSYHNLQMLLTMASTLITIRNGDPTILRGRRNVKALTPQRNSRKSAADLENHFPKTKTGVSFIVMKRIK